MTQERRRRGPRWLRSFLIVLLILLLATLGSSFLWQPTFLATDASSPHGFKALHAQAPAATLSAIATALGGADFELLNDLEGERIAGDLDLYAWYATSPNASGTSTNPPSASLPEDTAPETTVPDTDSPEGTGAQ
ncbi:MAG TPA: hypothetical protein VGT79_01935 [Xanthomonadaceae bacterium]|nr:hypothetical protein [Xanthomonadaceae bacterium]